MKRIAFIICFLFLPFGALMAQEVRVGAQVDTKSVIYAGDRFVYHIIIEGVQEAGDVDTAGLKAYFPKLAGSRDYSESSIRIINGKRTERVNRRYIMTYSLLAGKAGTINLPSVNVTVAGKNYKTRPLSVTVVEPARSEKLDLELSVSKKKCYVGEPVEISLKWYVHKEDVATKVEIKGVSFVSPIFDSGAFYIERIINEPKALNDRENYLRFQVNGKNVPFAKRGVKRKGEVWVELAYSAVFIPKHAGNVRIKPGRVLADLAVGRVVSRGFFGGDQRETKRFMAESKAGELEVIPLPDVARPKEAYGLVGNYRISASAAPTIVDVGEPITLTVKVGGSRLLKPVRRPDLEDMEGFADNFRISTQREDPVVKGGEKIFTMTIRAASDLVTEIPAIPLVFFDTDKGKYVTARAKPIPLNVSPSEVVTIGDVEFTGNGGISSHVEAVKKGMAANVVDIELVSHEFSPLGAIVSPGYLSLWGVPFAAFIVSAVVRLMTNTSDAKVAASRRRGARKNAESMLKAAVSKEDVAAAMREYVGWRFGKSAGALTGGDCERIIAGATGDERIAKEYRAMFEKCEASRYTGGGGAFDAGGVEKVISLIVTIDKKSGR